MTSSAGNAAPRSQHLPLPFGRQERCPKCGADLHACRLCREYDRDMRRSSAASRRSRKCATRSARTSAITTSRWPARSSGRGSRQPMPRAPSWKSSSGSSRPGGGSAAAEAVQQLREAAARAFVLLRLGLAAHRAESLMISRLSSSVSVDGAEDLQRRFQRHRRTGRYAPASPRRLRTHDTLAGGLAAWPWARSLRAQASRRLPAPCAPRRLACAGASPRSRLIGTGRSSSSSSKPSRPLRLDRRLQLSASGADSAWSAQPWAQPRHSLPTA